MITWLFLISSAVAADKPLTEAPSGKFTINFSKGILVGTEKNREPFVKLKKVAMDFAKEGTMYKHPVELHSLVPVFVTVDSKEFKYQFMFNLKASDGALLNCVGLGDEKLDHNKIGCYLAIEPSKS